jgi:hypothetical protein
VRLPLTIDNQVVTSWISEQIVDPRVQFGYARLGGWRLLPHKSHGEAVAMEADIAWPAKAFAVIQFHERTGVVGSTLVAFLSRETVSSVLGKVFSR